MNVLDGDMCRVSVEIGLLPEWWGMNNVVQLLSIDSAPAEISIMGREMFSHRRSPGKRQSRSPDYHASLEPYRVAMIKTGETAAFTGGDHAPSTARRYQRSARTHLLGAWSRAAMLPATEHKAMQHIIMSCISNVDDKLF